MPRIFIPDGAKVGDTVDFPDAEARKLRKVLRMKKGDGLTLFDGANEYDAEISYITPKSASAIILNTKPNVTEPPIDVVIGQGLPKSDKFELVVQKASELGASAVVPLLLARSVKRPDTSEADKKLQRYRRICVEAARQSGRLMVPDVPCFMDLPMFIELTGCFELKIVLYEGEKTRGLREILHGSGDVRRVAVLIGPEGGLTPDEVLEAEAAGYVTAGIGPRILRTETAGLAALAIIQYELGDLG